MMSRTDTLSDVTFSSGFGRHKYGDTSTHFSEDGRLVTSNDNGFPRSPHVRNGYQSYDPDRRNRYNDDAHDSRGSNDYYNRRYDRGRDYGRDDRGRDYGRDDRGGYSTYDNRRSRNLHYQPSRPEPTMDNTPLYGRTLPKPLPREVGPPTRYFDDYRGQRSNSPPLPPRPRRGYDNGDYNRSMPRAPPPPIHHHDRDHDWRLPFASNGYDRTGLIASRNHGGRFGVLAKRKVKRTERPLSWFFFLTGVLMLVSGSMNVALCTHRYYFCLLWISALTMAFGVVGVLHGGHYKRKYRNIWYIITGLFVMLAAMVGTGLVLETYVREVKELVSSGNVTEYLKNNAQKPLYRPWNTETHVWVCLSTDSVGLVLLLADYVALYAVIMVAHLFWNNRNSTKKIIEPFCRPRLFNPFMQLLLGEVLVLVGLVAEFAKYGTRWTYWTAPVAGLCVIMVGSVSAWAAKNPKKSNNAIIAAVSNFLGLCVCLAAGVVNSIGVYENISTLVVGKDPQVEDLYASAIILAIVVAVVLVTTFYCIGLLVRFSYYATRTGYDQETLATESRSAESISTVRNRYGYDHDRYDNRSDPPLPYRSNTRHGFFSKFRF